MGCAAWYLLGYAFAYGDVGNSFIGVKYFGMQDVNLVRERGGGEERKREESEKERKRGSEGRRFVYIEMIFNFHVSLGKRGRSFNGFTP